MAHFCSDRTRSPQPIRPLRTSVIDGCTRLPAQVPVRPLDSAGRQRLAGLSRAGA